MPLGFAVVPDVYSRYSMCSESTGTAGQSRSLAVHDVVPPDIPARGHGRRGQGVAQPADHEHVLDGGAVRSGLVRGGLEVHRASPAPATVGSDDELGLRVRDATRERLRAEATEHHRVGGPDAGAREHRDGQLRDHGHVDGDAVAGAHAQLLERVGRLLDLPMQVREGDGPSVPRLADPVVGDLVTQASRHVPVHAVLGDVERATREPLRERQVPLERALEG